MHGCGTCEPESKVKDEVICRIEAFADAIEKSRLLAGKPVLSIDGISNNGVACEVITHESKIKILNNQLAAAFEVEIPTIVTTPLEHLIKALETGEFVNLNGVTRIVGYYSRIANWNKSKVAELKDRHKGNYEVGCKGLRATGTGALPVI